MDYYCVVCDRTMKFQSKNNLLNSISCIQYETCFIINNTTKNLNFFDID